MTMKRKTKIKRQNRAKRIGKRGRQEPVPIYTTEHIFHIDDDSITDLKALWRKSLCGKMVQMGRQNSRWPWCKKCEKVIDDAIAADRAEAKKTKKATWETIRDGIYGQKRNRIVRIVVQKFAPPAHILERLAKGQERGTGTKKAHKTTS